MSPTLDSLRLGFVGAGQMAQALARALVHAQLVPAEAVGTYDVSPDACKAFGDLLPGTKQFETNQQLVAQSDLVVLAVKPQHFDTVASAMEPVDGGKLVVSILAGVPLDKLCRGLGTSRVVRVMPNTPCLVGLGASGYALGSGVQAEDQTHVERILSAVGLGVAVPEYLLDAVTGLSGSGPAYVFLMIEALADGGVQMGLSRDDALRLATQTFRGAAQLVLETQEHPAVLKDRVASPGGTTIAGLRQLEDRAVRAALMSAVQAATERSRELGQGGKPDKRKGPAG